MKKILLSLTVATVISTLSTSAYACTISPLGDTQLRMKALLNTFNQMETLQELSADGDIYRVTTYNHSTRKTQQRSYELLNSSFMCPIYTVRELR